MEYESNDGTKLRVCFLVLPLRLLFSAVLIPQMDRMNLKCSHFPLITPLIHSLLWCASCDLPNLPNSLQSKMLKIGSKWFTRRSTRRVTGCGPETSGHTFHPSTLGFSLHLLFRSPSRSIFFLSLTHTFPATKRFWSNDLLTRLKLILLEAETLFHFRYRYSPLLSPRNSFLFLWHFLQSRIQFPSSSSSSCLLLLLAVTSPFAQWSAACEIRMKFRTGKIGTSLWAWNEGIEVARSDFSGDGVRWEVR